MHVEKNQQSFLARNKILISIIVPMVLVLSLLVYLNIQFESINPTQDAIKKQIEPTQDIRFNIENFDGCVDLLINYTSIVSSSDEKIEKINEIIKSDILAKYNAVNCQLVENQLSQTDKYKNRND